MKAKTEVSRADFVVAVREFKQKHHGKLKKLLNKKLHPNLVQEFFNHPVINAYLARPHVTFVENHPHLFDSKTKADHDNSDHYELKVYQYLPDVVLYRNNDIATPKFYSNGTVGHILFDNLYQQLESMVLGLKIHSPQDIYTIRNTLFTDLMSLEKDEEAPRFIISPNWKDHHATIIFSVIEPETKKILVSLFLNSQNSPDYFKYSHERFIMENHISQQFVRKFAERAFPEIQNFQPSDKEKRILINEPLNAALAFNYGTSELYSPEFEALRARQDIEAIYQVGGNWVMGRSIPKQPFIDVSHQLQTHLDDFNCVLYGLNFVYGIVNLLNEPTMAEKITALSREIANDPDTSARDQLVEIFREQLKTYLPYYDKTGQICSEQEIRNFHINERWELGKESVHLTSDQNMGDLIKPSIVSIFKSKIEDIKDPIPNNSSPNLNGSS